MSTVDVVYLAWNRLKFTEHSFGWLTRNTPWDRVQKLVVYDDGSTDGTLEYLEQAILEVPCVTELRRVDLSSPPAIMNHYVTRSDATFFAKIDNDIVVPEGWLDALLGVYDDFPEIELLGTEAGRICKPQPGDTYTFEEGSHTGGVGLFRTAAFAKRPPMSERKGRFGFTEWQMVYKPVRGWIKPDLLVSSLDVIPFEPWFSLTEEYHANGWMRNELWPRYDEQWTEPYWGWWRNGDSGS